MESVKSHSVYKVDPHLNLRQYLLFIYLCIYFTEGGMRGPQTQVLVGSPCIFAVTGSVTRQQHPGLSRKRVSSPPSRSCFYSPSSALLTCGIMNDMLASFFFLFFLFPFRVFFFFSFFLNEAANTQPHSAARVPLWDCVRVRGRERGRGTVGKLVMSSLSNNCCN